MPYSNSDLTTYTQDKLTVKRFFESITICEHGKRCKVCCWLWQGYIEKSGYGRFFIRQISIKPKVLLKASPTRFYYTLIKGHTSLHILHTCDIKACCNIHHLYAGTHQQNMNDMKERNIHKDKVLKGEQHKNSRFTEEQVRNMRHFREKGYTLRTIANKFYTSPQVISRIVRRTSWKHIRDIK